MSKPRLDIRRADDTSALFDFKCGVKMMDDFIQDPKNGLAKFIQLRLSNLWLVYEGEKVVALFALSKDVRKNGKNKVSIWGRLLWEKLLIMLQKTNCLLLSL